MKVIVKSQKELSNHDVPRMIISLQHTGTRFLCSIIDAMYRHVDNPLTKIENYENMVVISPLRQPELIWRSWLKRVPMKHLRKKINTQVNQTADEAYAMFMRNLKLFEEAHYKYNPFYVPIDLPIRDKRIDDLSALLNEHIHADWNDRVGHEDGPVIDGPEMDWGYVYGLPMFNDYQRENNDHQDSSKSR